MKKVKIQLGSKPSIEIDGQIADYVEEIDMKDVYKGLSHPRLSLEAP